MVGEGVRSRAQTLGRKLTSNPFFPTLFIGEAVKDTSFLLLAQSLQPDVVGAAWLMAFVSIILWLYTTDDVTWGLHQVEDAVDDTTND